MPANSRWDLIQRLKGSENSTEAVSLSFVITDSSPSCHSFYHNFMLIKMFVISVNWFGSTIRARKHKQHSACFFTFLKVKSGLIKSARLPRTMTEFRTMHMSNNTMAFRYFTDLLQNDADKPINGLHRLETITKEINTKEFKTRKIKTRSDILERM